MSGLRCGALLLLAGLAPACGGDGDVPAPRETPTAGGGDGAFVDVSAGAGLDAFVHFAGFTDHRYLIETMGGGVGWLDADGDGWLDAYLVQSAPLPEGEAPAAVPMNRLLRGSAEGRFSDVTEAAGVGDPGFGMGCAAADADGDGDPELYVTNVGPNVFYRNRGDGTFADDSAAAGVDDPGWGVSAGFFDADRDGDLDLYLVNYVVFTREFQRELYPKSGGKARFYPHPDHFDAEPDRFYENDGTGVFREAAQEYGFGAVLAGKGLGVAFADVEDDGDVDVYVANDSTPNFLFLNDGRGRFREEGELAGCSHNLSGQTEASMGVAFGDATGDGLPELFVTHLDLETNTYYENRSREGLAEFFDATRTSGLGRPSLKLTGFGTGFLDWDADGALDLFVANGHIVDNAEEISSDRSYPQPDFLFRNRGDGTFEDASAAGGPHFGRRLVGRGVAFGDYDNDGDLDLLVGHSGQPPVLLENRAAPRERQVMLWLDGGAGEPPDGIGARVTLTAGGRSQVRELWTSFSYASASEPALHFGLGEAREVERVEVRWPSGAVETWTGLIPGRRHVLTRGEPGTRER